MSIAALHIGVGEGEKVRVESRIGCNAAVVARGVVAKGAGECSFSSSSSIGQDSDSISAVELGSQCQDSDEVESSYKEPLIALNALEESLPIRHGISTFYNGRSKSFTNLSASLSSSNSCKDLAKADNPYTRKRKNAVAFSLMCQQGYQKPTSCEQGLLGGVGESKRQKQSD